MSEKLQFEFEGKCVLKLEHDPDTLKTTVRETDFNLEVSPNLERSHYIGPDELPSQEGTQALINVFTQGLLGCIHSAHQKGYKDSAENLRFVISELQRGFIHVVDITEGTF